MELDAQMVVENDSFNAGSFVEYLNECNIHVDLVMVLYPVSRTISFRTMNDDINVGKIAKAIGKIYKKSEESNNA